jgi:hypothetical protein
VTELAIDITGAGPHEVVPAVVGTRVTIDRMLLTFSHASEHSLKVSFLSGTTLIAGPFYVPDGGEVEYERRVGEMPRTLMNDPFVVELEDGLSAAGMIVFSRGSS